MAALPPATGAPPPPPKRPGPRRSTLVGRALALLLVALGVAVLVGATWLQGPDGSAWLRGKLLPLVDDAIEGRVELGRLALALPNEVELFDVALYTPEGARVLSAARVRAKISLPSLLAGTVSLHGVELERPDLSLERDARGINLLRAIATGPEEAPPDDGGGLALTFRVRDLALTGGRIAVRWTQDGEAPTTYEALIDALAVKGRGTYDLERDWVEVVAGLSAQAHTPLEGPITLNLDAAGTLETLAGELALAAPGLVVEGRGEMTAPRTWKATLARLELAPSTAKIFVDGWPLKVPLAFSGEASEASGLLSLDVRADAASAHAELEGALDLRRWHAKPLELRIEGVQLDELFDEPANTGLTGSAGSLARRGASTPLSATLKVEGGGLSLETAEGTASLHVPVARVDGQRVGPARLEAHAKDGVATIDVLEVSLPGARASARGTVTREQLQLTGDVQASAIAGVLRLLRLNLPLQATGKVDFRVNGPLTHPGVAVNGSLASLDYQGYRAEAVTLDASLPDVRNVFDLQAHLAAERVAIEALSFEQVRLDAARTGNALTASLHADGLEPIALSLAARADDARKRLAIHALSLTLGEIAWRGEGTSVLSLARGFSWQDLALSAGPQHLTLDAALVEGRVDARLGLTALDLATLPRLAVPESLRLAGVVDGSARLVGPLSRPAMEVDLRLTGGGARHVRDLGASLQANTRGTRATGTLKVAHEALEAALTFSLPHAGFALARRGAVEAELDLARLSVPGALALAQREEKATGTVTGTLKLSGSLEAAELSGQLRAEQLSLAHARTSGLQPLAATLQLTPKGPREVVAELSVDGLGQTARVQLTAPTGPTELLLAPPTVEALLDRAWRVDGEVRDFPLSLLPSFGLATAASGMASMQLRATGPYEGLLGEVRLGLTQATLDGRPPVEGLIEVRSAGDETTLEARLTNSGSPMLDARAALPHSVGAILAGRLNARTPLKAELELHATPLSYLMRLTGGDRLGGAAIPWIPPPGTQALRNPVFPSAGPGGPRGRGARSLAGNVKATLRVEGTAGAPKAQASLVLTDLGQRGTALGQGRGTWAYSNGRHQAALALDAPGGGVLRAEGSAALDVSLPAFRRGLEPGKARLSATLFAERFKLDFLSRLVPGVRELGGQLDGQLRAEGLAAAPNVSGDLAWREGHLALEGFGEYRDGRVTIRGNQDSVLIEDFHLAASGGRLTAKGRFDRGQGLYQLRLEASLKDFPVVYDDQLFAVATAETVTVEGRVSPEALELSRVQVPSATFELPEVKRKDLQELERPEDVVLVRDGVPISRLWRSRLLSARRAAEAAEEEDEDAGTTRPVQQRDDGFRFGLTLEAPRNLWVKGSDLNLELGLSDRFRVEYADARPLVTGEVRVLRGRLAVLSRNFDVQRESLVRFTGPPKDPFVSAAATWNNENEQIQVTMSVRGQLSSLDIKATSEPPLPETEIYTLLATGRRDLGGGAGGGGGGGTGAQAASVVGGLVAGQLKNALANQLPLDVLNLEVGGSEGLSQARLEVGRYIGDKLYVGYTQRFGAVSSVRENTGTVRVEYQISPRFSLRGEFGDARQGGLDLLWSNEY